MVKINITTYAQQFLDKDENSIVIVDLITKHSWSERPVSTVMVMTANSNPLDEDKFIKIELTDYTIFLNKKIQPIYPEIGVNLGTDISGRHLSAYGLTINH